MKNLTLIALALTLLFSCKKDEPETPELPNATERSVFIANEGNFGSGNAEIGVWGLESNAYVHGVYAETNDETFGDTFQSVYRDGTRVFWVINGSGKIIVTDLEGSKLGEITGLGSPRYFLPINDQYAYVTDLYSGSITVVDHLALAIDHTFLINEEAAEELFLVGDKVYAIGSTLVDDVNYIYDYSVMEINTSDESITYTPLPHTVSDAEVTAAGNLLLAGSDSEFAPKLSLFNTENNSVESAIDNFSAGSISNISFNESTNTLYALMDGDVYTINLSDNSMALLTDLDLGYGYGFSADAAHNEIYVCDAADFVSNGKVYRISAEGEVLNEVTAGPLPKTILVP